VTSSSYGHKVVGSVVADRVVRGGGEGARAYIDHSTAAAFLTCARSVRRDVNRVPVDVEDGNEEDDDDERTATGSRFANSSSVTSMNTTEGHRQNTATIALAVDRGCCHFVLSRRCRLSPAEMPCRRLRRRCDKNTRCSAARRDGVLYCRHGNNGVTHTKIKLPINIFHPNNRLNIRRMPEARNFLHSAGVQSPPAPRVWRNNCECGANPPTVHAMATFCSRAALGAVE